MMIETRVRLVASLATIALMIVTASASAAIVYVDDNAAPGGDGSSWPMAHRFLRDALTFASNSANGVTELRIAQGSYKPDRSNAAPLGSGDRALSFLMINGVLIQGGYAGIGAPDPDVYDPAQYLTNLSGDLAGNDGPNGTNTGENSYRVLRAQDVSATGRLKGCTIRAARADGPGAGDGGGLWVQGGSPDVRECIFTENYATSGGAGMYIRFSRCTITQCRFISNRASAGGGITSGNSNIVVSQCEFTSNSPHTSFGGGGAIDLFVSLNPVIADCTFSMNSGLRGGAIRMTDCGGSIADSNFEANTAGNNGGGIHMVRSNPDLRACTFSNHTTGVNAQEGGCISLFEFSHPQFQDCIFSGNGTLSSPQFGGAVHTDTGSSPIFVRCTFQNNKANRGGAVSNDGTISGPNSPLFFDCSFSNNTAGFGGAMYSDFSNVRLLNCTVTGNMGEGIIFNVGGAGSIIQCIISSNTGQFASGIVNLVTGASPLISRCLLADNFTPHSGAGISLTQGSPTIRDCEFRNNISNIRGAAFINSSGSPTIVNCLMHRNQSPQGVIYTGTSASQNTQIINCTIANNSTGVFIDAGPVVISNSILWNDSATPITGTNLTGVTIRNSDVQVPWAGAGSGNISINPMFVNSVDPGDFRLLSGSPCIDAGLNSAVTSCMVDLDGRARMIDDPATIDTGVGTPPIVDMGAYEFGARAVIDCNFNGVVDSCDLAAGTSPDCNGNGVPDECDVLSRSSADCNANLIPDECEPDCNQNGVVDSCDIASRFSADCNHNGVPDECDTDCNDNGVPDDCDLANGIPDCNNNDIPDSCDIASGFSTDCDFDGIPDSCESDCNRNGVPDPCDISTGTSQDLNGNGVPDECDPDCNENSIPDFLDIATQSSQDCNNNAIPDECDIVFWDEPDCNANGRMDSCEIAAGSVADCNRNGQIDSCEILANPVILYDHTPTPPEVVYDPPTPGGFIWFNEFTIAPSGEVIRAIDLMWGFVPVSRPTTFCLWSDPNNDGLPNDAQLLMSYTLPLSLQVVFPAPVVQIPATFVGNAGQRFFVGVHLQQSPGEFPAVVDQTAPVANRSWFALGSNLADLSANPTPPALANTVLSQPGDWYIRARSGSTIDVDGNGIIDTCTPCDGDVFPTGGNGVVNIDDLVLVITQWGWTGTPGSNPADVNNSGVVDIDDLVEVITHWGMCP